MQNSNEEDFKKKYLKYKAKYLELKDLLEGGSNLEDAKLNCKKAKKDSCTKIFGCTAGKFSGCNFDENMYKQQNDAYNAYISAKNSETLKCAAYKTATKCNKPCRWDAPSGSCQY